MTQSNEHPYLGLPLPDATRKLLALGITPSVIISSAKRRTEGDGELRVVRQNEDGSELVACAFRTRVREDS